MQTSVTKAYPRLALQDPYGKACHVIQHGVLFAFLYFSCCNIGKQAWTLHSIFIDGCQTIDTLLQTPKHNFFSLVRASDQTVFDPWRTSPPVSPFYSDFRDQEQIRDFVATHLGKTPSESDLAACQYAILDERSTIDQTVILAHSYSSLEMRDPDTMTEDELDRWDTECEGREDEPDDSWCEWRVRFEDAEPLSTFLCFECDFTVKLYNKDFVAAHTDDKGVFHLESAQRAFEYTAAS